MNKQTHKRQVRRIEALRARWQEPLGLCAWSTEFTYYRTRKAYAKATGHDGRNSAATCHCDWRYMTMAIDINTPLWPGLDDWDAEQALVHELAHGLLDQLAQAPEADKQAHLEYACTSLANAFLWVRKAANHA